MAEIEIHYDEEGLEVDDDEDRKLILYIYFTEKSLLYIFTARSAYLILATNS